MKAASLSLLLLALSAVAHAKVDVPAPVAANYKLQGKAIAKGDLKTFFTFFDPAFIVIGADRKKQNFEAFKKEVAATTKGMTISGWTVKFTDSKNTPDSAAVSFVLDFMLSAKGQKKPVHLREVGTDTWRKTAHGWKLAMTVDKSFGPVK